MDDNQDLYKKIFQALAVIESKYAKEKDKVRIELNQQLIDIFKPVSVEDLEEMIESLQVRVDCLKELESRNQ